MRPTKVGVREVASPYIKKDEKGEFLLFDEAEKMLDTLFDTYTGIMCRYITHPTGVEELIISTVARKVTLIRIRIRR